MVKCLLNINSISRLSMSLDAGEYQLVFQTHTTLLVVENSEACQLHIASKVWLNFYIIRYVYVYKICNRLESGEYNLLLIAKILYVKMVSYKLPSFLYFTAIIELYMS